MVIDEKNSVNYNCCDCGVDTNEINEYYMVKNHVWPLGYKDGMLCIGCLEKRIGRELCSDDFMDILINEIFEYSDRLTNRLERKYGDVVELVDTLP